MKMKHGIDISVHNGNLDFSKFKNAGIEFVMIRAGYGAGNIDKQAEENCRKAEVNNIPYGLYWFSYAQTVEQAEAEARACLQFARGKRIDLPIAFDYEYDSERYANASGFAPGAELMRKMAEAFLNIIENAGYYAIIYSNIDYLKRAFSPLLTRWALWLADWRQGAHPSRPSSYKWQIWQTFDKTKLLGLPGVFDYNIMNDSLLTICKKLADDRAGDVSRIKSVIDSMSKDWFVKYQQAANDVIDGKYLNGAERVTRLRAAGYDPALVQAIVNNLLKK